MAVLGLKTLIMWHLQVRRPISSAKQCLPLPSSSRIADSSSSSKTTVKTPFQVPVLPPGDFTKFLVCARLSSSRGQQEDEAVYQELRDRIEPTIQSVWDSVGGQGNINAAVVWAQEHFELRIGSGVAGMVDGHHSLWDDVIRNVLPQAHVLLVFGRTGFVVDFASWAYALSWAREDLIVIFRQGFHEVFPITGDAFRRHLDAPSNFWQPPPPPPPPPSHQSSASLSPPPPPPYRNHPFVGLAESAVRRYLTMLGVAVETELHRYALMLESPADHPVFMSPSLPEARQGIDGETVLCPVCNRSIVFGSLQDFVCHAVGAHGGSREQPWDDVPGVSKMKTAMSWAQKYLKTIKSPLAVVNVKLEYIRRAGGTPSNNKVLGVNEAKSLKRKKQEEARQQSSLAPPNTKCPSLDESCPAQDVTQIWTPEAIAAHVKAHHKKTSKCLWSSYLPCRQDPRRLSEEELVKHLQDHQQRLKNGELPPGYADAADAVRPKRR
ncbi:unnamed protein product [Sympodiomycopsis kandeliae]